MSWNGQVPVNESKRSNEFMDDWRPVNVSVTRAKVSRNKKWSTNLSKLVKSMQQMPHTLTGQKMLKKLEDEDDKKKMDGEQIASREAEELEKERTMLLAKMKSQEKKVDYFERAKRLEEIPLLLTSFKERELEDKAFWEQQKKSAVQAQQRMQRMNADTDAFIEKLTKERHNIYLEKWRDFEKEREELRLVRMAERKAKRNDERRLKYLQEKEEEEERQRETLRLQEEEERLAREEQERKEREEIATIKREQAEASEKERIELLERTAAKQKQRKEEIERKMMDSKQAAPAKDAWRAKATAERKAE